MGAITGAPFGRRDLDVVLECEEEGGFGVRDLAGSRDTLYSGRAGVDDLDIYGRAMAINGRRRIRIVSLLRGPVRS